MQKLDSVNSFYKEDSPRVQNRKQRLAHFLAGFVEFVQKHNTSFSRVASEVVVEGRPYIRSYIWSRTAEQTQ